MKVHQMTKIVGALVFVSIFIASCGPVNFLTRTKKVPREHSLNYYSDQVAQKANKDDINKTPWIVYAQREGLKTTNKPGGKVIAKEINYLDPFLVIKQKGAYLALVKYSEEVLKNGKFDHKNAEFMGWLPMSDLLMENQSYTDVSSLRKRKYITALSDTLSLSKQEKLFSKDSILTYKDFEYKAVAQKIAFMDIVYPLKEDVKNKKVLIAKKPYLKVNEVKQDILGWIDADLLQYKGQVLNIATSSLFSIRNMNFQELGALKEEDYQRILLENEVLSQKSKVLTYNPVLSYSANDSLIGFVAKLAMPVFDNSKNFIYNVQGDKISYLDALMIDKSAKKMNVAFVFEESDMANKQYAQLLNVVQNLQSFFEAYQNDFDFKFSVYFSQQDHVGQLIYSQPWTGDFSQMVNYIVDKAKQNDFSKETSTRRFQVFEHALKGFSGKEAEQNLVILFGQKGIESTTRISYLKKLINNHQVKMLAVQLYADIDNSTNDFVLNVTDFIQGYATEALTEKKRVWVSPQQVKDNNSFVALGEYKNSYLLDFPKNSATQGAVIFPTKNETIGMDMIAVALDTLIKQLKVDKIDVQQHIAKSFKATGNNRTVYTPYFNQHFYRDTVRKVNKEFLTSFPDQKALWYIESKVMFTPKIFNQQAKYALLLDKQEFEGVKNFIDQLSKYEVELQYLAKKKSENKNYVKDERDLFKELQFKQQKEVVNEKYNELLDGDIQHTPKKFDNTRKIRKHLYQMYMDALVKCTYCNFPSEKVKKASIAQAQRFVLGAPTNADLLEHITLKDLRSKRKLKDVQLDFIINYFKEKKKELEKAEEFESLGQTYYWLPIELLP